MKNKKLLIALSVAATLAIGGIAMAAADDYKSSCRPGGPGIHHKGDFRGGMQAFQQDHAKLLDLLKMDEAAFRTEIRSGKTLATIGQERGVSQQQLQSFLQERMTQRLDQMVKDGRITADRAETMKANMATHVDRMMNGTMPIREGKGPRSGQHGVVGEKLQTLLKMDADTFRAERQAGKTLADMATERGVSVQELKDVITAARTERIDQMVKDGRITADRAVTMKANMADRVDKMVNGTMPAREGKGPRGGQHGIASEKVLALLKMDANTFRTERQAGKTLADMATERGVSVQELKDVIIAARTERIDQMVKDGRITADRAAAIKANMADRVDKMVNGTMPAREGKGPR